MNMDDICTEAEASALAGVSERTLQRFCESGYLTATASRDGNVTYLRSQISAIFGLSDSDLSDSADSDIQTETAVPLKPSHETIVIPSLTSSRTEDAAQTHVQLPQPSPDQSQTAAAFAANRAQQASRPEIEIERLRNLLAIQERMLDAKDDEIADLKNQRAWLRGRIEKLEEKSDRDQILLLSETQTIRSLIAFQDNRKSTFRQLLEWIGIAPTSDMAALPQKTGASAPSSNPSSGRTIEVRQAANEG